MEDLEPPTANDLAAPTLFLNVRQDGATGVIGLAGEFDHYNRPYVEQAIGQLIEDGASAIHLDLGALRFIDSAGVMALMVANQMTDEVGVPLSIGPVSDSVKRVLDLAGLTDILLPGAGPSDGFPSA